MRAGRSGWQHSSARILTGHGVPQVQRYGSVIDSAAGEVVSLSLVAVVACHAAAKATVEQTFESVRRGL